jgi:hypothetical protein
LPNPFPCLARHYERSPRAISLWTYGLLVMILYAAELQTNMQIATNCHAARQKMKKKKTNGSSNGKEIPHICLIANSDEIITKIHSDIIKLRRTFVTYQSAKDWRTDNELPADYPIFRG